jgi:hypothetical protein
VPGCSPAGIGRIHAQRLDERRLHDEALAPIRQQKAFAQLLQHGLCLHS